MQHQRIPTRDEAADARVPSAFAPAPLPSAPLDGSPSGKGSVAPAPYRPAWPSAADGPRPAAPDYRTTPEARGYGAG